MIHNVSHLNIDLYYSINYSEEIFQKCHIHSDHIQHVSKHLAKSRYH
jgi:hypothetical protein